VVRRRFGTYTSTFEWADHRLAVDRTGQNRQQSYGYDRAGRLVSEVIADQRPQGETTTTTWTYDDRGSLADKVQIVRYRNGAANENRWTWAYDDHGRMVRETSGSTFTERVYRGRCADGIAAPKLPDPLQFSGAAICVTSPGYLYDSCGY
jgi:YD repeat-containing protein